MKLERSAERMSPISNDTPPTSPRPFGEDADDDMMNEGDAIEVIDLDEVAGLNDDEDEMDEEEEGRAEEGE